MNIFLNGTEISLDFEKKYGNGQPAIVSVVAATGEPYATLTTCIDVFLAKGETILDTNNIPNILERLDDYDIVRNTGRTVQSGFCTYPIVELTYMPEWVK